jgi:hypothetical protein
MEDGQPLDASCNHLPTVLVKVFNLVELLDNIIAHVEEPSSLASCARVSKVWSEFAISHLWREIATERPLLNLIGIIQYFDGSFHDGTWVSRPTGRYM